MKFKISFSHKIRFTLFEMKFYRRFDEPIYQDYGHHDGNLVINPRDRRATILDFGENEDPDVRKKRIENVVTRFLVDV